jgi:hypothetical protein
MNGNMIEIHKVIHVKRLGYVQAFFLIFKQSP